MIGDIRKLTAEIAERFKHRYYDSSMSIGSELFQRIKEVDAQVVTTDCAGCEMQMDAISKLDNMSMNNDF